MPLDDEARRIGKKVIEIGTKLRDSAAPVLKSSSSITATGKQGDTELLKEPTTRALKTARAELQKVLVEIEGLLEGR